MDWCRTSSAVILAVGLFVVAPAARGVDSDPKFLAPRVDAHGFRVHEVESSFQHGRTRIRVLLPDSAVAGRKKNVDAGRKYPALYVLPVEAADGRKYGDGLAEIKKQDLHNRYQIVCVAPTFSHLPWYADHPTRPEIRQESYLLKVVLPFIERTYPVGREPTHRRLLGFSKSGWGAISLLLRHPKTFSRAAAWDAPLMVERPDRFGMAEIFGTQEQFDAYRLSTRLRAGHAMLGNQPRIVVTGYDNFRDHHVVFHAMLSQLDVPHIYRDGPKRKHAWDSGWVSEAVELLNAPVEK